MSDRTVAHDSIVVERTYTSSPETVFAAWSDSKARQIWESSSITMTMRYDNFDFRVGGRELSHCSAAGEDIYHFDVRYEDIVPNQRVVFASRIDERDNCMAASLVTVDFCLMAAVRG